MLLMLATLMGTRGFLTCASMRLLQLCIEASHHHARTSSVSQRLVGSRFGRVNTHWETKASFFVEMPSEQTRRVILSSPIISEIQTSFCSYPSTLMGHIGMVLSSTFHLARSSTMSPTIVSGLRTSIISTSSSTGFGCMMNFMVGLMRKIGPLIFFAVLLNNMILHHVESWWRCSFFT